MDAEPQTLTLTPAAALAYLAQRARELLAHPTRTILGIAGGPGTGKSTLAQSLVTALGPSAAYVPMDGFHMLHSKLEALGTVADKGMPHTFEAAAFVELLTALKSTSAPMTAPAYSRRIEDVVPDAITIPATAKLLVVEGNYLLLANAPWWPIRPLLDLAVHLEVPREIVRARLLKRHAEEGLFTEERNRAHIERVDLPNYDLVQRSNSRADIIIELQVDS